MGTVPARMETERDRPSAGSHPRGSEPMDESGTRARRRGITGESRAGVSTQTERRADGAASRIAGSGGTGSWVPRSRSDDQALGAVAQKAVWRQLSSGTLESYE